MTPYAALDDAVATMAAKLVDKFPECLRYTKQQTNFWKDFAWYQTAGHAREWLALHYTSLEPYEGMHAFVEKRRPRHVDVRQRAADDQSSEFVWGPYNQTCASCGASGIPAAFDYCGRCGGRLGESATR